MSPSVSRGNNRRDARATARTVAAAASALAILLAPAGTSAPAKSPPAVQASAHTGITVGSVAPDFTLASTDGSTLRLSDFRGQAVILNFWATWCPPCRAEMPLLDVTDRKHANLVVLGVNVDATPAQARDFTRSTIPVHYPVLVDPTEQPGTAKKVAATYRALGLPTSYFIDKTGVIRMVWTGGISETAMPVLLAQVGVK